MDDRQPDAPAKAPAPAAAKAPNPRELAARRKRQAVAGSLLAFGATVALVLSHPIASDASTGAGSGVPAGTSGGPSAQSPTNNSRPVSPQGGAAAGQQGQPNPTFFAPSKGEGAAAPAPQVRSGSGRRGAVGSGGS